VFLGRSVVIVQREEEPKEEAVVYPRLTERDRRVFSLLALARHLSTGQLGALCFPGRSDRLVRRRLLYLSDEAPGRANKGYVRKRQFRTSDGHLRMAWELTALGEYQAGRVIKLPELPARPAPGVEFLEHNLGLNEILVRLAPRDKRGVAFAPDPSVWTWTRGDLLKLDFSMYESLGREKERLLRPDAVVTLPRERRRLFIEFETGNHPIRTHQADRHGATIHKVARYATFFQGYTSLAGRDRDVTFCARAFPDGFAPELVIVSHGAQRRDNVNAAIDEWARRRAGPALKVRAVLLADLVAELSPRVGAGAGQRAEPPPRGSGTPTGSRVFMPRSAVGLLVRYFDDSQDRIHEFRDLVRGKTPAPATVPEYPATSDDVFALLTQLRGV
jgi:hypothetical protein